MAPPVDAMRAPSAALAHQFNRRCGAEFRWGRLDRGEGGGLCRYGRKDQQAGSVAIIVRISASIGTCGPNVRDNA